MKTGGSAKAEVASATATTPTIPTTTAAAAASKRLDDRGFYTISTLVDGQEVAITFIPPEGTKVLTNNASKAKVEARKLTKEDTQLWQPHDQGDGDYTIFTKISDTGSEQLSGIMAVVSPDPRMADDDKYQDRYNRVSVTPNYNETQSYWKIEPAENGTFRLMSALGEHHTTDEDWPGPRALEAVKTADGTIKLRHAPVSDARAQHWKLTLVGH